LLAQTADQKPVNGVISGGNILAAGTIANVPITATGPNTVSLTLNPVVASVNMVVTPGTLHTMYPGQASLGVYALDADGNVIVSGTYVNADGAPAPINLSIANNPNSSVTFTAYPTASSTTASLTGSGSLVTLYYANYGAHAATIAANAADAVVTINASGGATGSATLNLQPPTAVSYPLAHALSPLPSQTTVYGLRLVTVGSIGPQIWYVDTDAANNGGLDRFDLTNFTPSYDSGSAGNVVEGGIALNGTAAITGGSTAVYSLAYSPTLGLLATATCEIECGPVTSGLAYDSQLSTVYWGITSQLVQYPGSTYATGIPGATTGGGAIGGVAVDSSGNVFYADTSTTTPALWEWNPTTTTNVQTSLPGTTVFDVEPASGGGYVWVTLPGSNAIASASDPGASFGVEFFPVLGSPRYLWQSPQTGGLWFTETTPTGIALGRYNPLSPQVWTEAAVGAAGGDAGGVVGTTNATGIDSTIYVLHFTAAGGEMLAVTP
jgi:hypothetical protein